MDRDEMKELITGAVSAKLGEGYHVSVREMPKTNVTKEGIAVAWEGTGSDPAAGPDTHYKNGTKFTPVIGLDHFYEKLNSGESVDNVADMIIRLYGEAMHNIPCIDPGLFRDYGNVRDRLFVQLINRNYNRGLLESVPHSDFLDDLSVVVRCNTGTDQDGNHNSNFLVHEGHLDMWGIDRDTLMKTAMDNTRKSGITLQSIGEVMSEMAGCPMDEPEVPMWVLSNDRKVYGASAVLLDDVLKDFANAHGSFYVILSSVHEALLILDDGTPTMAGLTAMNQTVNANEVDDTDVLGTHAYYYDREKGFLSQAEDAHEK